MQALRNARRLARLLLAWFALSLGVAIASPVFHHGEMELVCSASGSVKLLVKGDTGGTPAGHHALDCPLCAGTGAPPSVAKVDVPFLPLLGHVVQPIPAARIAALTAAPLPARGPPAFAPT